MQSNKGNKIAWFVIMMTPSLLLIPVLTEKFPYTGLERILFIPLIIFINLCITTLATFIIGKINKKFVLIILPVVIAITIFVTLYTYTEYGEPVLFKILGISSYTEEEADFSNYTYELNLPQKVDSVMAWTGGEENGGYEDYLVHVYNEEDMQKFKDNPAFITVESEVVGELGATFSGFWQWFQSDNLKKYEEEGLIITDSNNKARSYGIPQVKLGDCYRVDNRSIFTSEENILTLFYVDMEKHVMYVLSGELPLLEEIAAKDWYYPE